jgi:hypothetical protein
MRYKGEWKGLWKKRCGGKGCRLLIHMLSPHQGLGNGGAFPGSESSERLEHAVSLT